MRVRKKEERLWKKEQNPWKRSQSIQRRAVLVHRVSKGIKSSLCASNMGEAEQEEENQNLSGSDTDLFSDLSKQVTKQRKRKKQEDLKWDQVNRKADLTSNSNETDFLNQYEYRQETGSQERNNLKKNSYKSSTKSNPYGWESSTGRSGYVWESAKAGQAASGTAGGTSGMSTGAVTGQVASGTTGVAASTGGAASSAAGGAAGGVAGVAVSGSVMILQKAKEHIEESLQKSKQEKLIKQKEKERYESGGTGQSTIAILGFGMGSMLFFSIVFSFFFCILVNDVFSSKNQYNSIVEVAKAELEDWEDNIGGTKYKDWYGMNENWCAMFVSYCAGQCGYIESGIMPKTASVRTMSDWYKECERYESKESGYEPKAGDIVFFQEWHSSHTGIVIEYDPATETITTIEGNSGNSETNPYHEGSRVKEHNYPLTYWRISGYGLPDYPDVFPDISTEMTEEVALLPKKYAV